MITLPAITFAVYVDYGPKTGMGSADFSATLDDAADAVVETAIKYAAPWCVEQTDRETGTVTDVTEQVREILRHRAIGRAA